MRRAVNNEVRAVMGTSLSGLIGLCKDFSFTEWDGNYQGERWDLTCNRITLVAGLRVSQERYKNII